MSRFFKNVKFLNDLLPLRSLSKSESLVIFDQRLKKNREFKHWVNDFDLKYSVVGGEELKDLNSFAQHFTKIAGILKGTSRDLRIVAVGGGSVTDFAGFFASIYKRGVPLVLIPSTWLAAIDSAHGGKTALNSGEHKNSLGTFYFAKNVFIVKSLLMSQPRVRQVEAYGELLKIALISGGAWTKDFLASRDIDIWKYLRPAIAAKYKVLNKDPYEKKGIRKILNLGHTLGHVFEKQNGIPHGLAVGQGIIFASRWSEKRGLLEPQQSHRIQKLISELQNTNPTLLKSKVLLQGLRGDKKIRGNGKVDFIFLKKPGRVVVESVALAEVIEEAKAQGWTR